MPPAANAPGDRERGVIDGVQRARSPRAPLRRLGRIGLAAALPLVLLITLWPTQALLRLKPRIIDVLEWLHERDVLRPLTWVRLEMLANVAMLIPLGLLLTFALGRARWWLAALMCVALSAAVEITQRLLLPDRVDSVFDVVANSLGACIGVGLAVLVERSLPSVRRRGSRRAATASRYR